MRIDCKFKDEDGNIQVEGHFNKAEISFLLQYAVNNLLAEGVMFNIQQEEQDENEVRIKFPEGSTLN
jgi:cytoplasmic iron level regulating protein YaaA (DUF328/UPF0246 family)